MCMISQLKRITLTNGTYSSVNSPVGQCIRAQLLLRIGRSQDCAGSCYGNRLPVQKDYGANLEYVKGIGGQPGGHRGKMEVPA